MNEEQIYNPVSGINQMIDDIEGFLNPLIYEFQPVLRLLSIINLFLVIAVFAGMMFYLLYFRKHHVLDKLRRPTNYFAALVLLLIYLVLTAAPLRLGPTLSVNFGLVVMPMAVKLFGPVVGCFFGMIQYGASFALSNNYFSLSYMLVAGISAMIYGRIIYARQTTYMRCFWAKLLVNIVCNIILVPLIPGDSLTTEMADSITHTIVSNIILVPVQALAIYGGLILMRKVRDLLGEVSWGWGKQ